MYTYSMKTKLPEKDTSTHDMIMDFGVFLMHFVGLVLVIYCIAWLFNIELDGDSYAMMAIGIMLYKGYIKPRWFPAS